MILPATENMRSGAAEVTGTARTLPARRQCSTVDGKEGDFFGWEKVPLFTGAHRQVASGCVFLVAVFRG